MTFLRLLFFGVVLWWIARTIGRWLFGGNRAAGGRGGRPTRPGGAGGRRSEKTGYADLTDQRIEDAEYEEIEPEGRE